MKLPVFLVTLAASLTGSVILGIFAQFGAAKTALFAFVILVVVQLAYIGLVMILAAKSHTDAKLQRIKGSTSTSPKLKS